MIGPRSLLVLALLLVALSTGCIHNAGGIAASNVPLDGKSYTVIGPAVASDSAIRLFGIIPISGSNNTSEALNRAIANQGADAMVQITIENYTQYWILFSRHVTSVRGIAVQVHADR